MICGLIKYYFAKAFTNESEVLLGDVMFIFITMATETPNMGGGGDLVNISAFCNSK
jgi:hypothetical protein